MIVIHLIHLYVETREEVHNIGAVKQVKRAIISRTMMCMIVF